MMVYTFDEAKIPHRGAVLMSYARAEQLYRFFGNVCYLERSPEVYQICEKKDGETAILLVNASQDPVIDGCLRLDATYRTAELCGVEGELLGDRPHFSTVIPPYGVCAVVLR